MHEQDYEFLVDTGASHNFASRHLIEENSLAVEKGQNVKVKFANSDTITTDQFVRVYVDFGIKAGFILFTVLPSCPLVLGLHFLRVD